MRRNLIRRLLMQASVLLLLIIIAFSSIFFFLAPIHIGQVVISRNLLGLATFASTVAMVLPASPGFFVNRISIMGHKLGYKLSLALNICGVVSLIVMLGISIWVVSRSQQDLTTLGIILAFIIPAITFAIKGVFGGIFAKLGSSIYDGIKRLFETGKFPDDNNSAQTK